MKPTLSVSNILILLSVIATIASAFDPKLLQYGMNREFLDQWEYWVYFLQFFTSNFLHGGFLHLLFNSAFIYYYGNKVEDVIGHGRFLLFFILNAIFVWLAITAFWEPNSNTIGISGFALAIMSYATLYLYKTWNPEFSGWVTAIVLNIAMWFVPWISLLGHLFWAIFWVIYYFLVNPTKIISPTKIEDKQ